MKKSILLFLLICLGCTQKPASPQINISLINNGRSLKITGFQNDVVQDINRDSIPNTWQSLIPVYRMPADTDLRDYQPVQPGKYLVTDSIITFTPDTPFAKQQTYFVRYYQYNKGSTALDYIKNHQKPGKKQYTDLIFKQ